LKHLRVSGKLLIITLIAANILWFATFYLTFSMFWIKIGFSTLILAALSVWIKPVSKNKFRFDVKNLIVGLVSAVVLYFIFWAGKEISSFIFPFARNQTGNIYSKGTGFSMGTVFFCCFL
jgi:hypothetical protein